MHFIIILVFLSVVEPTLLCAMVDTALNALNSVLLSKSKFWISEVTQPATLVPGTSWLYWRTLGKLQLWM